MIEFDNYDVTNADILSLVTAESLLDIADGSRNGFWGILDGGEVHSLGGSNREASVTTHMSTYYTMTSPIFQGASTVALSANSSGSDRLDIIEVDGNGGLWVTEGAPGSPPVEPERSKTGTGLPNRFKIAVVLVKNGDTSIPDSQILDRRFMGASDTIRTDIITSHGAGISFNTQVLDSQDGKLYAYDIFEGGAVEQTSFAGDFTIAERYWDPASNLPPLPSLHHNTVILRRKYGYEPDDLPNS